jgi:hypothetical protein
MAAGPSSAGGATFHVASVIASAGDVEGGIGMKRSTAVAGVVLGVLATACGSGTSGGGNTQGTCSLAVTGALTASGSCLLAVGSTGVTNGKVAVAVSATLNGSIISLLVNLNQTSLQTGTYGSSSGTSVLNAGSVIDASNGQIWEQFFNKPPIPNTGSFTLTVSSTGASTPRGMYAEWHDPAGSLNVTLESQVASGASGTVTVQTSF